MQCFTSKWFFVRTAPKIITRHTTNYTTEKATPQKNTVTNTAFSPSEANFTEENEEEASYLYDVLHFLKAKALIDRKKNILRKRNYILSRYNVALLERQSVLLKLAAMLESRSLSNNFVKAEKVLYLEKRKEFKHDIVFIL